MTRSRDTLSLNEDEARAIDCMTLVEGPPGIETQRHVDSVIAPLVQTVSKRETECSAFVIACFSDPGLHSVREVTSKPVVGIAGCAGMAQYRDGLQEALSMPVVEPTQAAVAMTIARVQLGWHRAQEKK